MWKFGDNTMGLNWSGLGEVLKRLPPKKADTKIYSAEELDAYNKAIARGGVNMGALSSNLLRQLENTYTPYQKALRQWSNEKQAADKGGIGNPLNGIASFLTAGVSDLFQGNTPGSGAIGMTADVFNAPSGVKNWLQNLGSSITTFGVSDLIEGFKKADKMDGSFWDKLGAGFDRSVDPGGTVDTHTRVIGDAIYNLWPEITPYLKSLGTTIGTTVGSIIPGIGNIAGAAIGTGIGSKLGGGTRNYDYFGDAIDTLLSTGSAYLGSQGVNPLVRGALTTGGKLLKGAINPRSKNPNTSAELASVLASSLMRGTGISGGAGGATGTNATKLLQALGIGGGYTGVEKALSTLTNKSPKLMGVGGSTGSSTYAKDALATLTGNTGELSDAMSNMEIRNSGMIKQPEWLVNTADMEREEKMDYTQAIKQLMSS